MLFRSVEASGAASVKTSAASTPAASVASAAATVTATPASKTAAAATIAAESFFEAASQQRVWFHKRARKRRERGRLSAACEPRTL